MWGPRPPPRLTNTCVTLAEGSTSLFATAAFTTLPAIIFVLIWEHLQANSPSSQLRALLRTCTDFWHTPFYRLDPLGFL